MVPYLLWDNVVKELKLDSASRILANGNVHEYDGSPVGTDAGKGR